MYMVWFVCKMRLQHMCTFALENLMVNGLNKHLGYKKVQGQLEAAVK